MDTVLVFAKTLRELDRKIEELESQMTSNLQREIASRTGGDNWHNPNKIIQEGLQRTVSELTDARTRAKIIPSPKQNRKVEQGHMVRVVDQEGEKEHVFHIGSEIDTRLLGSALNKGRSRIISTDSAIGTQVIGKKKGDSFEVGDNRYKIEKIEESDLCGK